jgi:hypothetical protein
MCLILLAAFGTTLASQAGWGEWQVYERVTLNGELFLTIECRTSSAKGWHPKADWRVTNHSDRTLYNASIGHREYTLDDGTVEKRGPEGSHTIKPGALDNYMEDVFGEDGQVVTKIVMLDYTFAWEAGGKRVTLDLKNHTSTGPASGEEEKKPAGAAGRWTAWPIIDGSKVNQTVTLTLNPDGSGSMDEFPARWQQDGATVTMRVYSVAEQMAKDAPAAIIRFTVDGEGFSGRYDSRVEGFESFDMGGRKR